MQLMNDLVLDVDSERLIVRYRPGFFVCSSALWNGGFKEADTIVNLRVPRGYESHEPQEDLRRALEQLGEEPVRTVGMLTAARVEDAAVCREEGDGFRLWAVVTAGVGNAVRAGQASRTFPAYAAGTINTIVVADARMTDAALVNAVITATEAKAAALQDEGATDEQGLSATGTSTDAVVVACTQNPRYEVFHPYAGSATEIGHALARAVYAATRQAIGRERQREEESGR